MSDDEKKPRGFAAMLAEGGEEAQKRIREIASAGGRAAHRPGMSAKGKPRKKGHEFTAEKAREAGRLGGHAAARSRREKEERDAS